MAASIAQLLRALRPTYASAEEKLAYAVHAFFISEDYRLVAVGGNAARLLGDASSRALPDVGTDGWALPTGSFLLLYQKVSSNEAEGAAGGGAAAPLPLLIELSFQGEGADRLARVAWATGGEREAAAAAGAAASPTSPASSLATGAAASLASPASSLAAGTAASPASPASSLAASGRSCALGLLSLFASDASPSPPANLAQLAAALRDGVLAPAEGQGSGGAAAGQRGAVPAGAAPGSGNAQPDSSRSIDGAPISRDLPPPDGFPVPPSVLGAGAVPPPPVGADDRDPPPLAPGQGLPPELGGTIPPPGGFPDGLGGSQVGPGHPLFAGRVGGPPGPGRPGLPSPCPPGARWDPLAPPGLPGSLPDDYLRIPPGGIDPDMAQPGPGGDPTGGLGPDALGFAGPGLFPGARGGRGRGGGGGFGPGGFGPRPGGFCGGGFGGGSFSSF